MLRKLFLILLASLFLGGCGSTLKSSWNNFTAYYNTFYNAKENFKTGLKKVREQPVTIDPTQPVRIHPAPNQAGNNDFQTAIDKAAQLLRKHPDSKWVDDALLLIGKSNYYRQEIFPAVKKFEELQNTTTDPQMQSLAIIWKGRAQLDLKQYTSGVSFLETELEQYPSEWSKRHKGEIQSLIAQHHALLENWGEAAEYLYKAVSGISNKSLLGRTYFLLGQMLERQERYGEAYGAFGNVSNHFPDFEYLYWARFKQADIARKSGQYELALDIFQELSNDDKNLERRGRLLYEIADTYSQMDAPQRAEKLLKDLLYRTENISRDRNLEADIYFKLGRIYSDHLEQYEIAAAYFDSASTLKEAPKEQEQEESAEALAEVYGEYTALQNDIAKADSLLQLGTLSPQQLDSALARIKVQKQQQLEAQESDANETTLANRPVGESENTTGMPNLYGFLNYKNADLVNQSKTQFRLRWGDRPLVDNWRRAEAIQRMDEEVAEVDGEQREGGENKQPAITMNLDEIPRTPEARQQLKNEKANAQYKLGNLLLLNLNMPDSARYYFHRVLKNSQAAELHPPAMYSLFEAFSSSNNTDSLKYWGQSIREEYPESRYAKRVESRLGGTPVEAEEQDSTQQLLQTFYQLENDSTELKPAKLRKLALAYQSSELAPHIFYEAIKAYIQKAKVNDSLQDSSTTSYEPLEDSVAVVDSLQKSNALEDQLQFVGSDWDSVRFAVQQFDTTFSNAQHQQKVTAIMKMLEQDESTQLQKTTCKELDVSLAVQPDTESFLEKISYPENLNEMSLSGRIEYSFVITADGEVQSYELLSSNTELGIEEAFEEAFDTHLRFRPIEKVEDPSQELSCRFSFPIQL